MYIDKDITKIETKAPDTLMAVNVNPAKDYPFKIFLSIFISHVLEIMIMLPMICSSY